MRKTLVTLGTLMVIGGAALPANAGEKKPFDITHVIQGISESIPTGQAQDPEFVGCDLDDQACVGLTFTEVSTDSTLEITSTVISLSGFICVADETAPCGAPGDPGTGIVLTNKEVVLPGVSATGFTFQGEMCFWLGTPRPEPMACVPVNIDEASGPAQDLSGAIPSSILI